MTTQTSESGLFWVAIEMDSVGLLSIVEAWPSSKSAEAEAFKSKHPEYAVHYGWHSWELEQSISGAAALNRWILSKGSHVVGSYSDPDVAQFQFDLLRGRSDTPDKYRLEFKPYAV